jgi:ATP-dependent Lhr-like helicase
VSKAEKAAANPAAGTGSPDADNASDPMVGFHPVVRRWFQGAFAEPTVAQSLSWPHLQRGENLLILAPTGSGKTLAAFLAAIDRLVAEPSPTGSNRCRVLYVSPLKALAVDIERNLRAPLRGIAGEAERSGQRLHLPEVAVRTGDTPSRERARFRRRPSDILITTPESLFLLLTSGARETLRSVRWVIVDEIHSLISTKRGAHLAVSLERLGELVQADGGELQRIGLSATVRPVAEVARFLGGGFEGHPRRVEIADAGRTRRLELRLEVPEELAPDAGQDDPVDGGMYSRPRGIWGRIYPRVHELVRQNRSTLVFVNSRRQAERVALALNELAGEGIARAHHGSIAREERLEMEEALKAGKLPAMVATSTLELGIDMGAVDLVVQIEAPPSAASALQRVGRAGHQVGGTSRAVLISKHRADLLACAALLELMHTGQVEPQHFPRNPLDVLAQQVVAMVAVDDWSVEQLLTVIRRAAPFAGLSESQLHGVLDLLSGRYPSDSFAELRPRLTWDREEGILTTRQGAGRVAIANAGTIPDRGLFGVYLADGGTGGPRSRRVGELDEEMVFETAPGRTFVLGASTWRIEEITLDRVLVSPAPGAAAPLPFWKGEGPGRPLEFGLAIGRLSRTLTALPRQEGVTLLRDRHSLSEPAACQLLDYLDAQVKATGVVPDDRTIVIERCLDENGDWRVCLLSTLGGQVHAAWATALAALAFQRGGVEPDVMWDDDGIVARFPPGTRGGDAPPPSDWVLPAPEDLEQLVLEQLPRTRLFASRFREAAGRALLLPRKHPGQRLPLWHLRRRAHDLMQASAACPEFPMLLEAYRECVQDWFDLPSLRGVLRQIESGEMRTVIVDTQVPSPFAASLMFQYVGQFMYELDAPLAERRTGAMAVDLARLRELLGTVTLRDLLDPAEMDRIERELQHLTPDRHVRHVDALHDLLIRIGPLSETEMSLRCAPPAGACVSDWVAELTCERRIFALSIAGQRQLAAVEDAGRLRDALGIRPPPALPAAFLAEVRSPAGDLVRRFARTHGPFTAVEAAVRLGLGESRVQELLEELERDGRAECGEFRPGAEGTEWCDSSVLRALRGATSRAARRASAPVAAAAYARFLLRWQGVDPDEPSDLEGALATLEEVALPASIFERRILPARVPGYVPRDLDDLLSRGAWRWCGCGRIGELDGRIRFERTAGLEPDALGRPDGSDELQARIVAFLKERGASFSPALFQNCRPASLAEVVGALWALVWDGTVTNDTLHPLRALLQARRPAPSASPRGSLRRGFTPPPEAAGRWTLTGPRRGGSSGDPEWLLGKCEAALNRFGIVTREMLPGSAGEPGFGALYPVLAQLEERGKIRRGYFIECLSPAQFALPEAVEQLREHRHARAGSSAVVLAACDPANPYGGPLPWPTRADAKQAGRHPGALVVLLEGYLAAYLSGGERVLLTFPDSLPEALAIDAPSQIARALRQEVDSGRELSLILREIDGLRGRNSPMADALHVAGFSYGPSGFMKRV